MVIDLLVTSSESSSLSSTSSQQGITDDMALIANGGGVDSNFSTSAWVTTASTSGKLMSQTSTAGLYDDDSSRTAREWDDATWILTSSFIIFTMQSGFGMLESGCVSHKNEVNIMMKNVADVIFGGISYWMLGYGFSFGTDAGTNGFCGLGKFFLDPDDANMGVEYSRFVFQASFATTATTIVSGAVAERARFSSYLIFSFFNTFIYCFPAHWVWAESGWLRKLGVVDVAGDGPVHVVGGVSALIASIVMKPRKGRFTDQDNHEMESPIGAILGLFILWWSWLAFNCGSTFGISGGKWKVASSYVVHRKFLVRYVINGVLAALVAITACCAVTSVKESLIIGGVGALLTLVADRLMEKVKIDDPVSAFAVHGVGGVWGLLSTGLFAHRDTVASIFNDHNGLVRGGGFYLLGVQALEMVSIATWTAVTSFSLFKLIDCVVGLRLPPHEEEVGADFVEHDVIHYRHPQARRSLREALATRAVHVNPAYGLEDDPDSGDNMPRMCGLPLHARSIFTITSPVIKDSTCQTKPRSSTNTQNGHVTSSNGVGISQSNGVSTSRSNGVGASRNTSSVRSRRDSSSSSNHGSGDCSGGGATGGSKVHWGERVAVSSSAGVNKTPQPSDGRRSSTVRIKDSCNNNQWSDLTNDAGANGDDNGAICVKF